jgi:hypothetical protein
MTLIVICGHTYQADKSKSMLSRTLRSNTGMVKEV